MSFAGYLGTIEAKTGKDAAALRAFADEKGWTAPGGLAPGVKPMTVVAALKGELGLGHGHAMAVVALLKGKETVHA